MTTKQAKIKCPHCGMPITIRQIESGFTADLSKELDQLWKYVDSLFKKVFK